MCWGQKKKEKYSKKLYDTSVTLMEQRNIVNLRKRLHMLIVDDENDDLYRIFAERQYDVYYKNDITYAIEAEPFDIVLMDIRGVAGRRKSNMEGFALAMEIKKRYPFKRVCCYSGSPYPEIMELLTEKKVDGFLIKDMDIDRICDKVDNLILDYVNVSSQEEVLRQELRNCKVSEENIPIVCEVYRKSFAQQDFRELNETLMGVVKNVPAMMNLLTSVLNMVKALAV